MLYLLNPSASYMKLEYLDLGKSGASLNNMNKGLVRLFSYTNEERRNLENDIREVVIKRAESLQLHELSYIEALNCKVTFRLAEVDEGLVLVSQNEFICSLTTAEFLNLVERITLCDHGHTWLYGEGDEQLSFLLSPGLGGW